MYKAGNAANSPKADSIGETWWSKRWVDVLESFGMGTRLARGRSYARQGLVSFIDITPGVVQARMQGSIDKPYEITIELQPLSDEQWEQVTEIMVSRAVFAARLLVGEMPRDIEEAFHEAHLSLFPATEADLQTACSCPDWARPCKHIAAVYYVLAERFDADPFLLFRLRGRSKEEIIEALRQKRAATAPVEAQPVVDNEQTKAPEQESSLRLEDYLDTFWQTGETLTTFDIYPHKPQVENAVLKRLGAAPYAVHDQNMLSLLARAYDVVEKAALHKAMEE
jgi:uncharacterized Zn finger protein